ncbi:MAG: glyoxalase/bleomycin resistance/extradiol dioxygenase family protein [Myxococcales bacterium]|nr:glyoxalase/bleomycin resistance/extradiol dioxygenase family protein [Myxococcales bacterium]MCB9568342.1 hypothetical protein [Myxococcales bacterium]MCB9705066.1 hypothetical protein [Myxococcales bacterium]
MSAPQDVLFFLNLPVVDLQRTRAFFTELGFAFDERFSDERAICMALSDKAWVMWLTQAFFDTFTDRPRPDPRASVGGLYCISQANRAAVDALVDQALAIGGSPAGVRQDHGFMYSRAFADPDGHVWEVMWMDVEAALAAH